MVDITYWMNKDPATVSQDASVFKAVTIMKDKDADYIIIIESGRPLGIFTETDLLKKVVARKKNPSETKIKDVMTSPIETIHKNSQYADVLNTMKEKNYRHVPVVDEFSKLIGVVTLSGLIKR
jgi:CBS domain-containing protein